MRSPIGKIGCLTLLTITQFCQSSDNKEENDVVKQRKLHRRELSSAQNFFNTVSNSARLQWSEFWRHEPKQYSEYSSRDTSSNMNSIDLEGGGLVGGERRRNEVEETAIGNEQIYPHYNQYNYTFSVSPLPDYTFDIKRMKRKLKQEKIRKYQRGQDMKQRRKQQRKRQQRKKLMNMMNRNNRYSERRTKKINKRLKETRRQKARPESSQRPNIILIVADDLGFNDVPWHNPDVRAPNLLKLARQGIILENHYVLPLCTPSRAALLTGDYPFRYGKQAGEAHPLSPIGLNTSITLLPQRLKELGYNTHLIGKWHLGYCNWDYTPTRRGFDSFYGFYLGSQTYYTHFKKLGHKKGSQSWLNTNEVNNDFNSDGNRDRASTSLKDDQLQHLELSNSNGISEAGSPTRKENGGMDFRLNDEPLSNVSGIYSNELYASRAEELIRAAGEEISPKSPMFMMLSMQAVHGPVQVPLQYRRKHRTTKNLARRTFLGMVSALDDAVGRVIDQLKASKLYNDSIILFTTDNGGNIQAGGNNFPLRGSKGGVFEGGTRGVAFVHSPLLPKSGFKYSGMMHIVDMHETILNVAKNGVNVPRGWKKSLQNSRKAKSPGGLSRTGSPKSSLHGTRHGERDGINMWPAILTNSESPRNSFIYNVHKKPLRGAIRRKNWKLIVGKGGRFDGWVPPWDVSAGSHSLDNGKCCTTWQSRLLNRQVTLYNLKDDPLETTDVSYLNPAVTSTLKSILRQYAAQSRQPHRPRIDPLGHPNFHGGFFSPGWCEAVM